MTSFWASAPTLPSTETHDPVNSPKHYMLLPGVEVIQIVDALCDKAQARGAMLGSEFSYYGQLMQYLMRFMDKGGLEDVKKARWYLDRLIASMESGRDKPNPEDWV